MAVRQAAPTAYGVFSLPADPCYVTATVIEFVEGYSSAESEIPTTTSYSSYIPTAVNEDCTTVTMTSTSAAYVAIETPSTPETSATAPGAYVTISEASVSEASAAPTAYVSVGGSSGIPEAPTSDPGAYVTISVQGPSATSPTPYIYPSSSAYSVEPMDSAISSSASSFTPENSILSPVYQSQPPSISLFTVGGGPPATLASTQYIAISSVGQYTPYGTVAAAPTSASSAEGTIFAVASSTPSATSAVLPTIVSSDLQIGQHFGDVDYFFATYLTVLVAVVLKELWSIVFASMKMMEPFHQLHKPGGASVSDSLLANYLSLGFSWKSIQSMFRGQWCMLFTTISYGLFAALSPISTECMKMLPTAWCIREDGTRQPCSPVWLLDKNFGRGLQALLGAIALMIVIVIVFAVELKSGIYSNPSSIAYMAALLNNDDVIEELRSLDAHASNSAISKALAGNIYTIEHHTLPDGTHHYGLVKPDAISPANHSRYGSIANPHNMSLTQQTHGRGHFAVRALRDSLFLLIICALFGIVLGYYLDGSSDPFNKFFNSGTWAPRFILTSVAVLISLHWKNIEREVRVITPYRRLSARNAKPEHTILVTLNGTPFTSLPGALRRGDWFHAFIAFIAITSELLIIAIAGVPFNRSQVWKAFIASAASSLAILGMMILTVFALFWWRVQNEKMRMPREPDTLVGVWMMLCNEGNGVRSEMAGTECLSGKDRDRRVREDESRWFAGWVNDTMGSRWVVERDGHGRVVGMGEREDASSSRYEVGGEETASEYSNRI